MELIFCSFAVAAMAVGECDRRVTPRNNRHSLAAAIFTTGAGCELPGGALEAGEARVIEGGGPLSVRSLDEKYPLLFPQEGGRWTPPRSQLGSLLDQIERTVEPSMVPP